MGPRVVGLTATACWSSGLALAGLGCHLHMLPLIYAGYSLLGRLLDGSFFSILN